MPSGPALILVLLCGLGYAGYTEVVKPAAVKVAHVTKATGKTVGKTVRHLVTFGRR